MRNIYLFAAALFSAQLGAQITLSQANQAQPGETYVIGNRYSNFDPNVQHGSAGPSQTWNFSTTSFDVVDTTHVVAASWIPSQYSAPFPQANTAFYYGSNQDSYDMLNNTTTGMYYLGSVNLDAQFGVMAQPFQNVMRFMAWPMTYGNSYLDTAYSDVTFPTSATDSSRQIVTMTFTTTADAWGTLQTSSATYNVLRMYRVIHYDIMYASYDPVNGWSSFNTFTQDSKVYEWWTNTSGIGWPVAQMNVDFATDSVTSYNIMQNHFVAINDPVFPGAQVLLYPNPATDRITLEAENGQWEILNANGQLVKSGTVVTRADIGVAELSAGIYIMSVTDHHGIRRERRFVIAE